MMARTVFAAATLAVSLLMVAAQHPRVLRGSRERRNASRDREVQLAAALPHYSCFPVDAKHVPDAGNTTFVCSGWRELQLHFRNWTEGMGGYDNFTRELFAQLQEKNISVSAISTLWAEVNEKRHTAVISGSPLAKRELWKKFKKRASIVVNGFLADVVAESKFEKERDARNNQARDGPRGNRDRPQRQRDSDQPDLDKQVTNYDKDDKDLDRRDLDRDDKYEYDEEELDAIETRTNRAQDDQRGSRVGQQRERDRDRRDWDKQKDENDYHDEEFARGSGQHDRDRRHDEEFRTPHQDQREWKQRVKDEMDDEHVQVLKAHFAELDFYTVDPEAFVAEVLAQFRALGISEPVLAELDFTLFEGSVVLKVSGSHVAMRELRERLSGASIVVMGSRASFEIDEEPLIREDEKAGEVGERSYFFVVVAFLSVSICCVSCAVVAGCWILYLNRKVKNLEGHLKGTTVLPVVGKVLPSQEKVEANDVVVGSAIAGSAVAP